MAERVAKAIGCSRTAAQPVCSPTEPPASGRQSGHSSSAATSSSAGSQGPQRGLTARGASAPGRRGAPAPLFLLGGRADSVAATAALTGAVARGIVIGVRQEKRCASLELGARPDHGLNLSLRLRLPTCWQAGHYSATSSTSSTLPVVLLLLMRAAKGAAVSVRSGSAVTPQRRSRVWRRSTNQRTLCRELSACAIIVCCADVRRAHSTGSTDLLSRL